MSPYSKEIRREVLAACDRGEGTWAVALKFRCSKSWVRRVKQERRELGKTAPLLTRRRTPSGRRNRADARLGRGASRHHAPGRPGELARPLSADPEALTVFAS